MDAFVYRFTGAKRIANTSNTTRRDAQAYCSDAGHAISRRLIFSCALALCTLTTAAADRNWSVYLGDKGTSHYSTLKQLTPKNVRQLEVAWTYHSKDGRSDNLSQIQCNPLVIDGVLYGTTPALKLIALDAATGEQRWQFDPAAGGAPIAVGVNRGVVFWSEANDRRILY